MNKKLLTGIITVICTLMIIIQCYASDSGAISREEWCGIMVSVMNEAEIDFVSSEDEVVYKDTNNENVIKISQMGVMHGVGDGLFEPDASLTRQEAATTLYRFIGKVFKDSDITLHPEYTFIDDWKIDSWAKDAIEYLYYYNIIFGTDEYVISPLDNLTKEQAKLMAERVIKNSSDFAKKIETEDFTWAIEPEYYGLLRNTRFSNGLCAVREYDGKYGYINIQGVEIIPFEYDEAYEFHCGIAKVKKDGKYGYIDRSGNVVIPCEYGKDSGHFNEDTVILERDGKFGFADKNGKIIIPLEYEWAYSFSEGIAPVKKDGYYGYIDKNGTTVIDFKFKWASSFSEGLARIGEKGSYSYIDKSGEIAIDCKYDYIYDFVDGLAIVMNRDNSAVIDKMGNIIVPFEKYMPLFPLSDGMMRATKDASYEQGYVFLDSYGNTVIKNIGNIWDAEDFHEGLAAVATHSNRTDRVNRSYINKSGVMVYPKREAISDRSDYDDDTFYLQQFSEGYAAVVTREGKLGFIKNPLF